MTPPLQLRLRSLGLEPARGVSDHLSRVLAQPIDELQFSLLAETATHIGVTDEFDLGLFLKRARVLQQSLGDSYYHRERYARLKGL